MKKNILRKKRRKNFINKELVARKKNKLYKINTKILRKKVLRSKPEERQASLRKYISFIDIGARKNIIHINKAARLRSRIQLFINKTN